MSKQSSETPAAPEDPFKRTWRGFFKSNGRNLFLLVTGVTLTVVASRLMREKAEHKRSILAYEIQLEEEKIRSQKWKSAYLGLADRMDAHQEELRKATPATFLATAQEIRNQFEAEMEGEAKRVRVVDFEDDSDFRMI